MYLPHFYFMCIYGSQHGCGSDDDMWKHIFSSSMWVLGIKLRLLGFMEGTHWGILPNKLSYPFLSHFFFWSRILPCSPGWPQTQKSSSLVLLSVEIISMGYRCQADNIFQKYVLPFTCLLKQVGVGQISFPMVNKIQGLGKWIIRVKCSYPSQGTEFKSPAHP